jgi:hypothetical protein
MCPVLTVMKKARNKATETTLRARIIGLMMGLVL